MYNDFFVYALKDESGVIRYIGKTKDYKNRISSHFKNSSNPLIKQLINENWSHDSLFSSDSEQEILKIEKKLILKYRKQLYNIKNFGGISRKSNNITVRLKNIKNNEIFEFESQNEAAKFINKHKSNISYLLKGKIKHISGIWVLEKTKIEDIKINPRRKGYIIDKTKNYFNLYDTQEQKYITFKSVTDCAIKIKSDTTSVSMLKKGKLQSLKKGRYRLHADSNCQYKKIKIYDNVTDTITEYLTRSEFSKKYNIHSSLVSMLGNGKIKHIRNRFTLPKE